MNDRGPESHPMVETEGLANGMLRLFVQMVWLPALFLASGFEVLMKSLQGVQRAAQGIDGAGERRVEQPIFNNNLKERIAMQDDQDLSGDDLKTVEYWIIFTKYGLETDLDYGREVINYPTSGGSLGALKIAEYFEKKQPKKKRPSLWVEEEYPTADAPEKGWVIPASDLKYVDFTYKVIKTRERQPNEYDRQLVKAANKIATNVKELKGSKT